MKRVRVIKLGGSLLTMPNLKQKFQKWCRENPHPLTLIIADVGFVDPYFADLAEDIYQVRFVNLQAFK